MGGVLVDTTGWQGLFWLDAGIAVLCMWLTYVAVSESRDPDRPRSIDYAGTVLVALTLSPLILGVSKSGEWGWISVGTLVCLAITLTAGAGFVATERRVAVPLLDLALLRNRVLVGATLAILIGAGTINALMYLLSLYFQAPSTLGFTPLEAGLATLPATVGLVVVAPMVPRLARRLGARQTIGLGFLVTTVGFVAIGFADPSWRYATFLLPLVAVAVGMGLSNGPSSSAATAAVPGNQVGEASGVSNMARYVGAAVATALAATIYGTVSADRTEEGRSVAEGLSAGLAAASWVLAVFSALGILLAVVAVRRHRAAEGNMRDAAAAAAAHLHTIPTSASGEAPDVAAHAPTGARRGPRPSRRPRARPR